MDCIFCKIIAGELPSHTIFEDEQTMAFLNIAPVSEGHVLVVPKYHAAYLAEGSPEDALALMATVYDIAPVVTHAVGASGYNLGMNHGVSAGQEVLHTHLHIMPRQEGVERSFVKMHPSQEELTAIADKIRAEIEKQK